MSSGYLIQATPVFKITLQRLSAFLTKKYNAQKANAVIVAIKLQINQILSDNPHSAPVSERLAELGIADYRQLLVDQHNLVFFRVDEDSKLIVLLAIMDSRQSIEKLLFETNILF